ncbi:DUF4375 domain-containing protein [Sphingomonas sp. AR_OL41]|uniref:DMP19 family protein n=1 Tax=Sphingomonas sp. AR_OL41 TaxID=3042729 RepID=UPI0024800979|nr:DUF4375 domain-containing protein [Sphingomonas sp. AR_OL41]MDH7973361.1 DUF4375 domain-containing protein [Sphingomonas sp. AR_OL41]
MPTRADHQAWNNFVMLSDPDASGADGAKRSAAIAKLYMGGANNGGINAFLTSQPQIGSEEVLKALQDVGATKAAQQLAEVLTALGQPLLPATSEERWDTLEQRWTEALDSLDVLSEAADAELMRVLERHVSANASYYAGLAEDPFQGFNE